MDGWVGEYSLDDSPLPVESQVLTQCQLGGLYPPSASSQPLLTAASTVLAVSQGGWRDRGISPG